MQLVYVLVLCVVLFLEPVEIGPLKVSEIWKVFALAFITIRVFKGRFESFILFGFVYVCQYLYYSTFPYGYLSNIALAIEELVPPLLLIFISVRYSERYDFHESMNKLINIVSSFIILSTVPKVFFGVEGLYDSLDLSYKYGLSIVGLKGWFYHIASASKMFVTATVALILQYRNKTSRLGRFLSIVLISYGSVLVLLSWTRTAWFAYALSILVIFLYKASVKKVLFFVVAMIGCLNLFQIALEQNDAFRWRMTGGASYREEKELTVTQLLSARLPFIVVALDNLDEESFISNLIGHGAEKGKDMFKDKTGMRITSHNRTFEILEAAGIFGFIFFILFYGNLIYLTRRRSRYLNRGDQKEIMVFIILFVFFTLTSHGYPIWANIIFIAVCSKSLFHNSSIHQSSRLVPYGANSQ